MPAFRFPRRLHAPVRATLITAVLLGGCGEQTPVEDTPEPATLAVTNVRTWTGEPGQPWASALAVRGDTLVAVGDNADVQPLIGPETAVLDGTGALLVPGFIDAHVHFLWGGDGLASVQLRDAPTPEAFTRRIGDFAETLEPGEWVLNGAWDHENWGGELPHRNWIDSVTPENPVWITRLDGHMALANSLALELAGVTADTEDVAGGTIVRDADGRPTGVLKDNAMGLVARAVPEPSAEQLDRMARAAMDHVAAQGVTSVHDMGDFQSIATYRRAHRADELTTRIYAFVPLDQWRQLAEDVAANGRGDAWLQTGGLKGFMDGSLGSHTAAFFDPFTDAPEDRGLLVNEPADIERWVRDADAEGLQVTVHAIGDRAISMLLDIFGRVAEANGPRDRRFRMEHAQHIHPDDLPRFAELGVIPSMQPYHAIDDGRWAEKVIGAERAATTYAFASLLQHEAALAFGSDWPVAPPTPLEGIYGAVTRRTLDGANPEGWVPQQKISVEQALAAYTIGAARAGFAEDRVGTLAPGKLADFVILDQDITAIAPARIRDTEVLTTVVGGDIVYTDVADDGA